MLRIVGQKVSTKRLMAAFSDCFPSSSCLLLREYWNLVPNNISVRVKKTKIWLPFKTWCSLSVPRCGAYHIGNWNSWCLYFVSSNYQMTWSAFALFLARRTELAFNIGNFLIILPFHSLLATFQVYNISLYLIFFEVIVLDETDPR